jgi:hypothetical protein
MLDIFLRLKTLVKVSHIHIDSSVFRLHWAISSVILLVFSVIVTTRQYVGNPIDCIHTKDVPDDVFDLYCWIHSTYTIPRALSLRVGDEVAHPGVITSNVGEDDEKRYVSYYQWVGFTLFFQVSPYVYVLSKCNRIMFLGNTVLRPSLVVEELGSWQNICINDGLGRGNRIRGGKETKEEVTFGLPL